MMSETDRVVLRAIAQGAPDLSTYEVLAIGDSVLSALRDHTPSRAEVILAVSRSTGSGIGAAKGALDSLT